MPIFTTSSVKVLNLPSKEHVKKFPLCILVSQTWSWLNLIKPKCVICLILYMCTAGLKSCIKLKFSYRVNASHNGIFPIKKNYTMHINYLYLTKLTFNKIHPEKCSTKKTINITWYIMYEQLTRFNSCILCKIWSYQTDNTKHSSFLGCYTMPLGE